MFERRFVYFGIVPAALLTLVLALTILRTSGVWPAIKAGMLSQVRPAASTRTQDDGSAVQSNTDGRASPSVFKSDSGPTRDYKSENSSFILNILHSPKKIENFGSFRLIGIAFHADAPGWSSAVLGDLNSGKRRIFRLGDLLPDLSRLVDIQQNYIILEKDGVRRRLTVFSYENNSQGDAPFGITAEKVKKVKDNEWVLKPYQAFKGDVNDVLDFSLGLHGRDGQVDGIQISDVHEHSLAAELGLKEGDVLVAVNGQEVDSLYKCVRACFDARMSDELALRVRRGGSHMTLTYHLLWEGNGTWGPGDVLRSRAVLSLINRGLIANLF